MPFEADGRRPPRAGSPTRDFRAWAMATMGSARCHRSLRAPGEPDAGRLPPRRPDARAQRRMARAARAQRARHFGNAKQWLASLEQGVCGPMDWLALEHARGLLEAKTSNKHFVGGSCDRFRPRRARRRATDLSRDGRTALSATGCATLPGRRARRDDDRGAGGHGGPTRPTPRQRARSSAPRARALQRGRRRCCCEPALFERQRATARARALGAPPRAGRRVLATRRRRGRLPPTPPPSGACRARGSGARCARSLSCSGAWRSCTRLSTPTAARGCSCCKASSHGSAATAAAERRRLRCGPGRSIRELHSRRRRGRPRAAGLVRLGGLPAHPNLALRQRERRSLLRQRSTASMDRDRGDQRQRAHRGGARGGGHAVRRRGGRVRPARRERPPKRSDHAPLAPRTPPSLSPRWRVILICIILWNPASVLRSRATAARERGAVRRGRAYTRRLAPGIVAGGFASAARSISAN